MNKYFFGLLMLTFCQNTQSASRNVEVNAITFLKGHFSSNFFMLSWKDQAKVVGGTLIAGGASQILTAAFLNTFGGKTSLQTMSPSKWFTGNWRQNTVDASIFAGVVAGYSVIAKKYYPECMVNYIDSEMLDLIIEHKNDSSSVLMDVLDLRFADQAFSKVVAFLKLSAISEYLVYAKELIGNQHKTTPIYAQHLAIIKANIALVSNAILVIKANPTWQVEYQLFVNQQMAEMLSHDVKTRQASMVINLAHSFTRG